MGRSKTYFVGAQKNAQISVNDSVPFNVKSIKVDNPGPQQLTFQNPDVVVPAFIVGRVIPVTLQNTRVIVSAVSVAPTAGQGTAATVTYTEDSLPASSGSPSIPGISSAYCQVAIVQPNFAAASTSGNIPLGGGVAGNYNIIGYSATVQLVTGTATNIFLQFASGAIASMGLSYPYTPTQSIFPPLPQQTTVAAAGLAYVLNKSEAVNVAIVSISVYYTPAPS